MRLNELYKRTHYSWIITICASLVFFLSAGLSGGTFAIFLPELVRVMNLSYSQVSFIPTLTGFTGFFMMVFVRQIINKIGIRRTIFIGGILITVGTFVTASLKSVFTLYVGGLIIGLGFGMFSTIPISMLIVRWFKKSIGFAIGLSYAGSGVAVIIASPIFTYIIVRFGLQIAYLVLALWILITTILATLLIRNHPKDKNIEQYGYCEKAELKNRRDTETLEEDFFSDVTKEEHNRFLLMLFVLVIMSIPIKSIVSHMSSILTNGREVSLLLAYLAHEVRAQAGDESVAFN